MHFRDLDHVLQHSIVKNHIQFAMNQWSIDKSFFTVYIMDDWDIDFKPSFMPVRLSLISWILFSFSEGPSINYDLEVGKLAASGLEKLVAKKKEILKKRPPTAIPPPKRRKLQL